MLKRLEVARALEPRLLLDEPLAGLSQAEMLAATQLITDLRVEGNKGGAAQLQDSPGGLRPQVIVSVGRTNGD